MGYPVPNWAQAIIARAVNLDPNKVAVEHENDRNISFLQYNPRKKVSVSKVDGSVTETMDPFADKPKISVSRT